MTHPLRKFVLGLAALFLFCSGTQAAQNRALLIGISQYTELPGLRYADADVKAFSELLTDFGGYRKADVSVLLNQQATKRRIESEIYRAIEESKRQPLDHFILMFAGHGMQGRIDNKETNAFLAPSDADANENTFYSTGRGSVENETFINRAWLSKQLTLIDAKSIVIILDSCYSGTRDFGNLFLENLGYSVRSFNSGGATRGVAVLQTRNLEVTQGGSSSMKRIAYLASARDDQTSAEYDELRHGALSYSIFESIRQARQEIYDDVSSDLSVDSVYLNITKSFREVQVGGRSLDVFHQPLLYPIPAYADIKDMKFVSMRGAKQRAIRMGTLELRTDPVRAEITIDGVKRVELTNATIELPEGRHHIELYLPSTGYRNSFTADISAERPVRENIAMVGVLEVASYWLRNGVKSAGPNLDVFLDGYPVGTSGLRLDRLIAGTHRLEVRFENVSKVKNVEIRPDSPLRVNYSVIREASPRPPARNDKGVGNVVF